MKQEPMISIGVFMAIMLVTTIICITGCVRSDVQLTADQIMEIVKTDKDYPEIEKRWPDLTPEIAMYSKLSAEDYSSARAGWSKNDTMSGIIDFVDKLNLNDDTVFVRMRNPGSEDGFYAVIDTKKKQSLLIIIKLNIFVGM